MPAPRPLAAPPAPQQTVEAPPDAQAADLAAPPHAMAATLAAPPGLPSAPALPMGEPEALAILPAASDSADLVDKLLVILPELLPELDEQPERLGSIGLMLRAELGGTRCCVRRRPYASGSERLTADVLRIFDGRNASTVARILGISRATVYRVIKQAGRG